MGRTKGVDDRGEWLHELHCADTNIQDAHPTNPKKTFWNGEVWNIIDVGNKYYVLEPVDAETPIVVPRVECFPVVLDSVEASDVYIADDGQSIRATTKAPLARVMDPRLMFQMNRFLKNGKLSVSLVRRTDVGDGFDFAKWR